MSDAPDRLSAELDAFLEPERRRPDPPAEMQSEVFSRVGATLGWSGGPGPGGSDPPAGAAPGGHGGVGGSVAAHGVKHLATGTIAKTVATLIVGGVIGAGVHEAYDRATDRRAEHARVTVAAPPPIVATPAPPPPMQPEPPPATTSHARVESPPPRPEHAAARTEARERDRNLAAERGLIEQARTALAREQGAAALAALERHARDFPEGELAEERESLQVQALVALGRFEQARKMAARFHRRFPRSIFGAVVDEALKSIP
jgi:hypothetical protein